MKYPTQDGAIILFRIKNAMEERPEDFDWVSFFAVNLSGCIPDRITNLIDFFSSSLEGIDLPADISSSLYLTHTIAKLVEKFVERQIKKYRKNKRLQHVEDKNIRGLPDFKQFLKTTKDEAMSEFDQLIKLGGIECERYNKEKQLTEKSVLKEEDRAIYEAEFDKACL